MIRFIVLVFISYVTLFSQGVDEFTNSYNRGMDYYRSHEYTKAVGSLEKAVQLQPQNVNAKYNLACAYSLNGNKEQALELLNEMVDNGQGLDAETDGDFNSLRDTEEFNTILKKINQQKKPFGTSKTAFTIAEKDLIPEGITYDPKSKSFFLGSLYKSKIIRVDNKNKAMDFIPERHEGIFQVVGMKVDSKRNILWALSSAALHGKYIKPEEVGKAGVYKYDLASGKLIKKYIMNENSPAHFFNDITVADNGDVYFTDSNVPSVYVIRNNADKFEPFFELKDYIYPNGITLSGDNKKLFVAHGAGVSVIDLKTRKISLLRSPADISMYYIDGLYFYKNSLVGIQNFGGKRVARFYLDNKSENITKMKVLESYNPDFNIPTTGTIVGDDFYYIANSQLGSFDDKGKIFPMDKLREVIIKRVKL